MTQKMYAGADILRQRTGVERFSVCWAGVDRRSSSEAWIVIRADESRFLVKEKKKKEKGGRLVDVRESFHSRIRASEWSVFKSNVKYNI